MANHNRNKLKQYVHYYDYYDCDLKIEYWIDDFTVSTNDLMTESVSIQSDAS